MSHNNHCQYPAGEILCLLSEFQELPPGLYMLQTVMDGWATLGWVIDDEKSETLRLTDRSSMLPVPLLDLFMPVGMSLTMPW